MSISPINPQSRAALAATCEEYKINKDKNEAVSRNSTAGNAFFSLTSLGMIGGGIALGVLATSTMGVFLAVVVTIAGSIALYKAAQNFMKTRNAVDLTAGQDKILNRGINNILNPPAPQAAFAPAFNVPVAQQFNNNNNFAQPAANW